MASSTRSETSRSFVCEICVETKLRNESFSIKGCSHMYCVDCTVKYVDSKLQENVTSIGCPVTDCGGSLEPEYCRDILPEEAFDKWGKALCESLIPGAQKFYCPFKDCSALLIDDAGEAIRESECPNCHRLFCAQCKVAWHAGIECADFQKLHKDEPESEDIILMKLAQNQKWNRCPNSILARIFELPTNCPQVLQVVPWASCAFAALQSKACSMPYLGYRDYGRVLLIWHPQKFYIMHLK
ncbi:RING-type domain-containing protein [Citrus sinensis]|nr:RING-type domain-containing protein [Citrus sinensis]